jgi:hypothetical protein
MRLEVIQRRETKETIEATTVRKILFISGDDFKDNRTPDM